MPNYQREENVEKLGGGKGVGKLAHWCHSVYKLVIEMSWSGLKIRQIVPQLLVLYFLFEQFFSDD